MPNTYPIEGEITVGSHISPPVMLCTGAYECELLPNGNWPQFPWQCQIRDKKNRTIAMVFGTTKTECGATAIRFIKAYNGFDEHTTDTPCRDGGK